MINEKISELLDLPIRPGRWMTYTDALNREGKPDRITLIRMVMTLCEEFEILESHNARLLTRIEQLEAKFTPASPEKAEESPSEPQVELPPNHPEAIQIEAEAVNQPDPKEQLRLLRIANLKKAREAKNAKAAARS